MARELQEAMLSLDSAKHVRDLAELALSSQASETRPQGKGLCITLYVYLTNYVM